MKTSHVFTSIAISFFILFTTILDAQIVIFQSDECISGVPTGGIDCGFGDTDVPINVNGVGTLGLDNYGIIEVFFDIDQPLGLDSELSIVSPQGFVYGLASDNVGSFPGYTGVNGGQILNVGFRYCYDLPQHDDFISNPGGSNYVAFGDFTLLNDGSTDGDGTWYLRLCNHGTYVELYCASITFGQICPEADDIIITPASCSDSSDGEIEVIASPGSCNSVLYQLDDGPISSNNTFSGLSPGDYTIYIGEFEETDYCVTGYDVTVGYDDDEDPVLFNCPPDITIDVNSNCIGEWSYTDPTYSDNCDVVFASVLITYTDGSSNTYSISPGAEFPYSIMGVGEVTFEYTVMDDAGNDDYCISTVSLVDGIPPVITGVPTEPITYDCSDDPIPLLPQVGVDIFASDECAGDLTSQIISSAIAVANDCSDPAKTIETYTYSFFVEDGNGNSTELSYDVIVTNAIGPSWDPPFIADVNNIIEGECGVDDLSTLIMNNIPTATGCFGPSMVTEGAISFEPGCEGSMNLGTTTQFYIAEDECGNTTEIQVSYVMLDSLAPVISGVPDDITLNCNDTIPDLPMISAMDTCEGDVTSLMIVDTSYTTGYCELDSIAEIITYTLIANDFCGNADTAVYNITVVNDIQIDLGMDLIVCEGDSVVLSVGEIVFEEFLWSTGDTTEQIVVYSSGEYSVIATSENGCCSTDTLDINIAPVPIASASGGTIDCTSNSVQLMGVSDQINSSFNWIGPNGFMSNEQNPEVGSAGVYTLTVSSVFGCSDSVSVDVLADDDLPDIMASAGVIDCNNSEAVLSGSSMTADVTFMWTGPNGFSSANAETTTTEPGVYQLSVSAMNGCVSVVDVTVVEDMDSPVASLTAGTVDCINNNQGLSISATEDYEYLWSLDGNTISTASMVTISSAGLYEVVVTGDNGCEISFQYSLEENILDLLVNITTTEATNGSDGTASLELLNAMNVTSILWDNGQTGNMANNLTVGDHTVTVTDIFGCMHTFNFSIKMVSAVNDIDILSSIQIFPTIFTDWLNIEASFANSVKAEILIFDITGKVIQTQKLSDSNVIKEKFELSHLGSGVYLVSIRVENQMITRRVIKF